jgi:thiamine biosynthesis protein ThiS
MKITLNNRPEEFDRDTMAVSEIMDLKKFTFSKIIVKVNDVFIEKEDYPNTLIKDGDNVMILHLLAGG